MKKTNDIVFTGLHVIAWIIFVGLCIEAGGLIVNLFFHLYKPEWIHLLYQKLNLSNLYLQNFGLFYVLYSLIISASILKACLFYNVISLMHKMDLYKPFNDFVATQIARISYFTLSIGLLNIIGEQWIKTIPHSYSINSVRSFFSDSDAFILMGAVIYVIAVIFRKGVELQNENDLTV